MILKWKTILTNWINCYTGEGDKREQNITPENLHNIFTHIHENIRLDDSKSSKFEANTIQEFIVEKYPEFKFENGTLESTTEEEIYILASLLLFFICVNSKNADIKRVMCNKLSAGDQETIMKFSKCLMNCTPIMYADVEAAISEACGHDVVKVSETPPALRSLHGEVRRLQAALDAERFDRNYLQDELARTNLKLEKLTKVKEQYKLDILNLKAKISLCCGEQRESHREARADEFIGRLQRQLQELEARLEDTLGQLDDAQQERDTYAKKVSDLKEERDKWLTLSQQEADKAAQLADQLDTERRTVATLRDLVSELRQHNRNNGLDSSMLECDDPDTSIQSLSNLSVCNEVCANVIEVQLGEERDKIEILKQQIQNLQEQLSKANQNFESEKLSLESIITEKETNLSKLQQAVGDEIEEKNNLKLHYDHEIDSLNKKISEMTEMIKDIEETYKYTLEQKVQEIERLEANFVHETDRLNNVIKTLQNEIEDVNISKKQCHEEIVLLNNKIVEMTQIINYLEENTKHVVEEKEQGMRTLQQLFAAETEKSRNLIEDLEKDLKEEKNLKIQCEQVIADLNNKVGELSQIITVEMENSKHALQEKTQEILTLQQQYARESEKLSILNEKLQKDIEEKNNINIHHEQEIKKLNNDMVKLSQTARATEEELRNALDEKIKEIQIFQDKYADETMKLGITFENLKMEIEKQNNLRNNFEQENIRLNNKVDEMTQIVKNIEEDSKRALQEKIQEIQTVQQEFEKDTEAFSSVIKRLQTDIEEQINLKTQCEQEVVELNNKILEMSQTAKTLDEHYTHELNQRVQEIQLTKQEFAVENKKSRTMIENLQKEIEIQTNLRHNSEQEKIVMKNTIAEITQKIKDVEESSKRAVKEKVQEIQSLRQQLAEETKKSEDIIKKLQNKTEDQKKDILKLSNEITALSQTIKNLEESSKRAVKEKVQEIQSLRQQLAEETKKSEDIIKKLQNKTEDQKKDILKLSNEITALSQTIKNLEESSKLAVEEKLQEIQLLQQRFVEETKKLEMKNKIQEIEILEAYEFKKRCDQEIVTLNHEIDAMRATMQNAEENSKLALEEKVQEKHCLQQQYTVESEKLSNVIQELKTEKLEQLKLQEDLENRIAQLDATMLKQNNELADIEKELMLKTEMIEQIQLDLRKEKELKDELSATCNRQLITLNDQKVAIEELQSQLSEKEVFKDKLDKDVKNLNIYVSNLEEECKNISEEKQKVVESRNQEITKLNNSLTEKARAIKDLEDNSRHALEEKALVIQTLHQQFAAERGKSENIIKNLTIELEAEKYAQLKLKDDFDNRFMKMNEKVLNRNNELVELQDNIIQKSELIEVLQSDLRREKELRDELSNTCNHQLSTLNEQKNAVETILQQKLQEITELQKQLQEKEMLVIKLKNEVDKLSTTISSLDEKCRQRDGVIREKQKEIEFINDIFQNEQEKLNHKMDERNASIKSLQMQLENEIEYKMQLQRELSELQAAKHALIEEVNAAKVLAKDHEETTLLWEKQKIEMSEQIKTNILKVEKIEDEKLALLKEIESLKDIQSGETKNHEEKLQMCEIKYEELSEQLQDNILKVEELVEEKIEMSEQIKTNILKVEKLEEEKLALLKEIESLKDIQSGETKNHADKLQMCETKYAELSEQLQDNILEVEKLVEEKIEMSEQIKTNILKVEKLEEEKLALLRDIESLKDIQSRETKNHEEKLLMYETKHIELNKQLQANILEVEKVLEEKALLLKEIEVLKSVQSEEAKNHAEEIRMWEKQKIEMNEQMQVSALQVEKVEEEKVLLMKEIEALKAARKREAKGHDDSTLKWKRLESEIKEQLQTHVLKIEKLEEEKTSLIKEHEANNLLWVNQKDELHNEIQNNISKMKKLEDEKELLMKEMEELNIVKKTEMKNFEENKLAWEKQKSELEEQVQANIDTIKKLENEKILLLEEIENHKLVQNRATKDLDAKMVMLDRHKNEIKLLTKEVEQLKITQTEEMESLETKNIMLEEQITEMKEQINLTNLKVEELEKENAMLLKELEALKFAQSEETKKHEEKTLVWETQMAEISEQMNSNLLKVQALEEEKAILLKEIEVLKATEREEVKTLEEKTLTWERQKTEMSEQINSNMLKVQLLEEEKAMLLKEIETVKAAYHEEKTLIWERQKSEMNEQIQTNVLIVEELQEEKAMLLKELEAIKAVQMETCFITDHEEKINMLEKQEILMKEEMQANARKLENLEEEKNMLSKELEALKAAQKEMLAMASHEKITATKHTSWEKELQGMHHQVDTTTSDLAHSSMDSLKTISDLEKIIQDKNRKITMMQTEITYIKSMMAESGIKYIDVSKELEVSKDTCQELSSQLKKIVHQKNEEISELRRQIAKMSATENRASQIIKVSAKYQAMILKRIAEIKSNAVLKELTNFGNQNSNGDSEIRRSFAGSVTMEDLENFLETTDKHLKRCSEKQLAMQKDRDRLSEVNRINESEIINMKKFLTEMSVSFRTFCTVKEVYNQKLSKIVSLQRTVRRDILSLDGRITEATMCKLERGYAAVMQDLSECAMNLERWVDRSVSRMLSAEKIKQAFTSDLEQASLSTGNYQNAAVEVQLSELENSFQKLLAEIDRAQKGEGARTAQEVTIMEVRAEYEDKLNRMKAKMKELFHDEMGRLKQKQADELAILERELAKSREKMAESSRAYEEHIRALTTELWSVGEKFLVKQEEADWLRKKQSGSLMSLQHVHSSGLQPPKESFGRPSDTHSLRSLPVHNKKPESRGLHMSDEEGEVFDNRFLKELSATPRASLAPGQRISELKRRNSLVPPHLKSSYPAEMQFAPTLDEEDIKCASTSFSLGRPQRKEVGITAYKKPGPPTPSKQAGRLSATDSELRELRMDPDAQGRKTSTPSRIRSLFRSNRNDLDAGTPRSRRFSNMFRKK